MRLTGAIFGGVRRGASRPIFLIHKQNGTNCSFWPYSEFFEEPYRFHGMHTPCPIVMRPSSFIPAIKMPANGADLLRFFRTDELADHICRFYVRQCLTGQLQP